MKKIYVCMMAMVFLMNTLTGCSLKNDNIDAEAIYREFPEGELLNNGDAGKLQWSWILEPGEYEDIRFVNDNLADVQDQSGKWGLWDLEIGVLVIPCKYDSIPISGERPEETSQATVPLSSQYDIIRDYAEGYAAVQKDGKWGFVDETGQCVIPCQYDEVGDFSEGLAAVKDADHNGKGEQWAYIDTKGEIRIDFYPYEATEGRRVLAGEFHDGMAFVSRGLYCIMDTKGEMIFSGDSRFFISVTEYNKEYDAIPGYVYIDDRMTIRKYGLMGLHGEERLEPVFDYVYGTRGPYVIVEQNIGRAPKIGVIKLEKVLE